MGFLFWNDLERGFGRNRGKDMARRMKVQPVQPEREIVFERADPKALAAFDPATKRCTMNCGPHAKDPRSRAERMFLCDDCITLEK